VRRAGCAGNGARLHDLRRIVSEIREMNASLCLRRTRRRAHLRARRDPGEHLEIIIEALVPWFAGERHAIRGRVRSQPDVDGIEIDAAESWCGNANHRIRPPLDVESPANDAITRAERTPPEAVAQHGDRRWRFNPAFIAGEEASPFRRDAEQREIAGAHMAE